MLYFLDMYAALKMKNSSGNILAATYAANLEDNCSTNGPNKQLPEFNLHG